MNRALQQLIRGVVLQVLNDNNVTDQAERERQLTLALNEAASVWRSLPPQSLLQWAVGQWCNEVQHRPLQNVNRRPLDDAWRQVVRFAGGNPDVLLGPSHDERMRQEFPGGFPVKMSLHVQSAINSMEAESAGKSDDWKAGACAVIEALKRGV